MVCSDPNDRRVRGIRSFLQIYPFSEEASWAHSPPHPAQFLASKYSDCGLELLFGDMCYACTGGLEGVTTPPLCNRGNISWYSAPSPAYLVMGHIIF